MTEQEQEQLVALLLDKLGERGMPEGAWLFEIEHAREQLRQVDSLLRRLSDAIIAAG